jgi:hypothetical protein
MAVYLESFLCSRRMNKSDNSRNISWNNTAPVSEDTSQFLQVD